MSCEQCTECLKYYNSGSTGGYNCAETTIYGISKALNMENKMIPRIATLFGGGFGRNGQMCGSLIAGGMVLSMYFGRDTVDEERAPAYAAADRLLEKFSKWTGGKLTCSDITGLDLKVVQPLDPEKLRVHEKVCTPIVEKVCGWVVEDIQENYK